MTKVVTVGIANMAHQGVPPAALGPPVPQQRLLGRTPSPQGRPEPPGESCSCGVPILVVGDMVSVLAVPCLILIRFSRIL